MKLRELIAQLPTPLPGLEQVPEHPALDQEIKGLSTNSQTCQPGDLFIGMPGTRVDGGDFWQGAIAAGAVAAIVTPEALAKHPATQREYVLAMPQMAVACAAIAAQFYGCPAQKLQMVGVTGTNGKTTTTHLIEYFLQQAAQATALIGTLYTRWPGYEKVAVHTTPFAVDLQAQLAEAQAAGSQVGIMEVSSHALHQGRARDIPFEVAVFTNLTQDHLDYHETMENYFAAKAILFSPDYLQGRAVVNQDDVYGQRLIAQLGAKAWSYSISEATADFWLSDLDYQADGVKGILHTPQGEQAFTSPLVGQFNLANVLAAAATAMHLGATLEQIVTALPQFMGVPGRMERVQLGTQQDISVIVDYAHTPDSLENLLQAARPFIPGRAICVFGCGGDRDRTKRPQMGKIAAELADLAIVTSDNPRTEDPEQILQDVVAGIDPATNPMVIGDRAAAIKQAILDAKPGDGVLIAGKGHEDYQILGTQKIHFDDREQARAALAMRLKL
ncbi:MAG: UDP-N-acetylmuramoyl-L-alanyl-D-glutamate--2,6-diaminopimelate ligase [Cyanobacteria bacterium P01_G01_bin.54]